MTVLTLTEDNFKDTVERHPILVIDFSASWCSPCQQFVPVFEAAAARHTGMRFATIDVDAQPDLASGFGIRSVPSLLIIREKILVARESGALSVAALQQVLERAHLIDMDDLRAEMAAAEGDMDAIDH